MFKFWDFYSTQKSKKNALIEFFEIFICYHGKRQKVISRNKLLIIYYIYTFITRALSPRLVNFLGFSCYHPIKIIQIKFKYFVLIKKKL